MQDPTITRFDAVDHHRNGVGGRGFTVIRFQCFTEGKVRNMIATCFDELPECTAVYDVDLLAAGNVAFAENSWRGDVFFDLLAPFLKAQEEA